MVERCATHDGWVVLWTLDGHPALWIRELAHEQRVLIWLLPPRLILGWCCTTDQ